MKEMEEIRINMPDGSVIMRPSGVEIEDYLRPGKKNYCL